MMQMMDTVARVSGRFLIVLDFLFVLLGWWTFPVAMHRPTSSSARKQLDFGAIVDGRASDESASSSSRGQSGLLGETWSFYFDDGMNFPGSRSGLSNLVTLGSFSSIKVCTHKHHNFTFFPPPL